MHENNLEFKMKIKIVLVFYNKTFHIHPKIMVFTTNSCKLTEMMLNQKVQSINQLIQQIAMVVGHSV